MSDPVRSVPAMELNGAMIGQLVSFTWMMPGGGRTQAVVTGELRQISHSASDTVVHLSSHILDTGGEMDEFVLDLAEPIRFLEQ